MFNQSHATWRTKFLWIVVAPVTSFAAAALVFARSARPGALIVRWAFDRDAAKVTAALKKHAPSGVVSVIEEQYRSGDSDAHLDVYFPESDGRARPTVIWTHGGAWVSGNKSNYSPYFELLASRGFSVVSVEYSLGPERRYPTPVGQLNDAHAYVLAHAQRLHVDPTAIFLAGDSAGSQLTSQLAAAISNPAYAAELGITPSLSRDQIRGVVLNCGIYDLNKMTGARGIIGWGVNQSLWAYTGFRDFVASTAADQMSTVKHVTEKFPPAYISGGNSDPLTDNQSKPFAERLSDLGVEVETLFYPTSHVPALGHEYQFNLDNGDGKTAFERTVTFLNSHLPSC